MKNKSHHVFSEKYFRKCVNPSKRSSRLILELDTLTIRVDRPLYQNFLSKKPDTLMIRVDRLLYQIFLSKKHDSEASISNIINLHCIHCKPGKKDRPLSYNYTVHLHGRVIINRVYKWKFQFQ